MNVKLDCFIYTIKKHIKKNVSPLNKNQSFERISIVIENKNILKIKKKAPKNEAFFKY